MCEFHSLLITVYIIKYMNIIKYMTGFKYNVIMNIFPDSTQFPLPLYPLITIFGGVALYLALFLFNLQKIMEKLFSLCSDLSYIQSTIIYLALINAPTILLSSISLLLHHNLIGFQVSCDIDYIQIILVSGYICHVQESRQTPIRGFFFIRDLGIMIGMVICFVGLYYDGIMKLEYGISAIALYFVYYIFMQFEETLEDSLLRFLGIRQTNVYNSNFLQTQPRKQGNYLKLKNTIEQHKQKIENQIEQYKDMLEKLYSSQDEKQILLNFAKLFLPYKNALQIQQNNDIEDSIGRICQDWIQGQQNDDSLIEEDAEDHSEEVDGSNGHESGACLMQNRTMTEDYVLEEELKQEESTFEKVIKYAFYPLYFISTVEGRVRYFLDYLCIFLLCGLMFLISCSSSYFTNITNHTSYSVISLLLASCLAFPSSTYYLRISQLKDFDFINIFLQSSILKSAIFGILTIIHYIAYPNTSLKGSLGLMISVVLNLLTYAIFGAFMIAHKFATLKTNLVFLTLLSIISFLVRIISEIACNLIFKQSTS